MEGVAAAAAAALGLLAWAHWRQREVAETGSSLTFLGTGSSAATPFMACILGILPGRPVGGCSVCRAALANPRSRDRRCNPSVLLQTVRPADGRRVNVVIDVGKTFREY